MMMGGRMDGWVECRMIWMSELFPRAIMRPLPCAYPYLLLLATTSSSLTSSGRPAQMLPRLGDRLDQSRRGPCPR